MKFEQINGALICKRNGETLRIEAWGKDSLRIRSTLLPDFSGKKWALTEEVVKTDSVVKVEEEDFLEYDGRMGKRPLASITNGRVKAVVNFAGVISFYKDESLILREYYRMYDGTISKGSRCLKVINREFKGIIGGSDFSLTVRFDSGQNEKIFGMGQYQQECMDLKGCVLELAQRNSQCSVPFALSSLGYGFLWNNPAVGRVTFGKNITEWEAKSTKEMDYFLTVADTPKEILENYTKATGRAEVFPGNLMGLWQCKLRYRTQEEVLSVARRYKEEGIKLDQIVIDFFHWPYQGDWKFDEKYWPDVKAMIDELHEMGTKVMVSVWPSVDRRSENFWQMQEQGLLIKTERGSMQTYDFQGDCVEIDAFNPETCEYVWNICKKNYYDLGIDGFWLDNAEPDFGVYDFENYRYYEGPALQVGNVYPQKYSRMFYEPMRKDNNSVVNLTRCAWAGTQKYGNVIWSGDVPSTFQAFQEQLQCGLNMGLAGIPWWTTDIGGFMTDDYESEEFKELLIRWYQFAVFSPVMRMHGDRGPHNIPPLDDRDWGGGYLYTGHDNELWSYGEEIFAIMKEYYNLRMEMREYIKKIFEEAHENGSPLLRTMFYEFPEDETCWELTEQYMFGEKYLVAPVFQMKQREKEVYLPKGKWILTSTGEQFEGGQTVSVSAPLNYMPVFERI